MQKTARVIISDGEKVLLGKRAEGIEVGKWNIFGGKVDEDETFEQAAKREVFEETGIEPAELEFLFKNVSEGWLSTYFQAIIHHHIPSKITEHTEVNWFSWQEIQSMRDQIAFNHYLVLRDYFRLY